MPTRTDFEEAAALFDSAAQQVGELVLAVDQAEVSEILRGGSLGRQVPERIAGASQTARLCRDEIKNAAQTCRNRAAIIEVYETQLDGYLAAVAAYSNAAFHWGAQYNAWFVDETGLVAHPGPQPVPPTKPEPPPEWADVVRP